MQKWSLGETDSSQTLEIPQKEFLTSLSTMLQNSNWVYFNLYSFVLGFLELCLYVQENVIHMEFYEAIVH